MFVSNLSKNSKSACGGLWGAVAMNEMGCNPMCVLACCERSEGGSMGARMTMSADATCVANTRAGGVFVLCVAFCFSYGCVEKSKVWGQKL